MKKILIWLLAIATGLLLYNKIQIKQELYNKSEKLDEVEDRVDQLEDHVEQLEINVK